MRLNKNERHALKKFKTRILETLGDNLEEVKLFGSKARGDARKDSDIDVLVVISRGN